MQLSKEVIDRFMKVDPAQVGHYIGGGYMSPKIKPVYKTAKLIGPAFTVRLLGKDSTAIYYAMKKAPEGAVIVVDRGGDNTFACAGEIVASVAQKRKLAGLVIDGPATDSLAIERIGLPVFCTGLSPVTTSLWGISGEINITVQCGGAVVRPGDIIFGDADGVIVIPSDTCEELLQKAEQATAREIETKRIIEEAGFIPVNIERLFEGDVLSVINKFKEF